MKQHLISPLPFNLFFRFYQLFLSQKIVKQLYKENPLSYKIKKPTFPVNSLIFIKFLILFTIIITKLIDNSFLKTILMATVVGQKKASILCPLCGSKFTPEFSNICEACTLQSLDEVKLLSANDDVKYCRFCERYERPPWINCHRESQQMLEMLLKKVKGLNKVHFLGAKFVWT